MSSLVAPVHRLPTVPVGVRRQSLSHWLAWMQRAFAATPARGWHSRVVWQRVVSWRLADVAGIDPARVATLELAAVLHDIGRAIDPLDLEPHAFVGARFLDDHGLHEAAALVAHHSGARLEAAERGMADLDRWEDADPELQALLDLADRTVDAQGRMVTLAQRWAELVERHGDGAPAVRRFDIMLPELQRTARRLAELRR